MSPALAESSASLIDPIPDLANTPDARDVIYTLSTHSSSGEAISVTASVADPRVASARISADSSSLIITPVASGSTQISVTASTARNYTKQTLNFSVSPLSKTLTIDADQPPATALVLSNGSDVDVDMEHNGFPLFNDRREMVEFVRSMPESFAGEPFERKLWRFLVNNTVHWAPLSSAAWLGDPGVMLNSLAWGFCGEVSASYVLIGREAGYQARIWGLSGHVVSEISIGNRWEVYDTDLVNYYYDHDHQLAGVEQLAADPALITDPVDPLHPTWHGYGPYSQLVADIYSSTEDNWIADDTYVPSSTSPPAQLRLPARSSLTYPGIWAAAPIGYAGTEPLALPFYKQANLQLPPGWTGLLPLAWIPWDIQGVGHVLIDGKTYAAGSEPLRSALQHPARMISSIQVLDSSALNVIMMINPLRYAIDVRNTIKVNGVHIWALSASSTQLPVINQVMPSSVLLPGQLKGPIS
ncbi:MAG: hypothetical protein U1F35_17505 [Steroidobacteraceae bacterium]